MRRDQVTHLTIYIKGKKEGKTMNVYQVVNERIIELLKKGTIPWRKPWSGGDDGRPRNLKTKTRYRGINIWLLASQGYSSPYWVTWKQAKSIGGFVNKGEKGTPCVFWRLLKKEEVVNGATKKKKIPILKYFTVFNLEQCGGISAPESNTKSADFNPIDRCEEIVANMPNRPEIKYKGNRAYYKPLCDIVTISKPEFFSPREEYYSCLYHELAHSTGHKNRLNRRGVSDIVNFGSHERSKEELIAEFGAAFLCNVSGISNATIENSAAYIQNWLGYIKENKKNIVHAASAGQKAAEYILGNNYSDEDNEERK